jgi:hypothetical protein
MLHDQTVVTFTQQARALCGQLDKAATWCAEQGVAEGDLLESRLADDMFPLAKQLDFVVAQMLGPLRRLTGEALPDPDAANGSLAAYRDRVAAAAAMIAGFDSDATDAAPEARISFDLPNGMAFDLTARAYVRDWAVPQFYFHVMAAYAILRMRGVPIGKADYVPHMGRHARR